MDTTSKSNSFIKTYGSLALVFILVLFFLPRDSKFPYEYKIGQEWDSETLYAQFDFPIYKSSEQLWSERVEEQRSVTPYYKYSEEVAFNSIRKIESLQLDSLRRVVMYSIREIYEKGVIEEGGASDTELIYIQRDKHAFKSPFDEVYTPKQAREKLINDLSLYYSFDLGSNVSVAQACELIVPNLFYDAQTTDLVKSDAQNELSPTSGYIASGQLIISQGEIVTSDIAAMLDSYRKEYESNMGYISNPLIMWLSNLLIALIIVVLLYFAILLFCPKLFGDRLFYYVLIVTAATIVGTLYALSVSDSIVFVLPITLMVLMLQTFLKPREYLPLYFIALMPILLFAQEGAVTYILFVTAGLVQALLFKYFHKGWRQFIAAIITFAVLSALFLTFRFANLIAESIGAMLPRFFMGSILTVLAYPLVYLLEKMLNLVSESRLEELCDTSNDLIRQMEHKAPGTFQHSLQLMNMADSVARAIGVNPELVRVGALYHDIGKINNPLCFVENEFIVSAEDVPKYHSDLEPGQSALDIINHVTDGVELARKEHLPQIVVDFILTHHGTTTVRYFYDKHLKAGGESADIEQFRYKGQKPSTKAQVILMICDSIEAASRTLKANTTKAYSDFVEAIVAGKVAEGQFDEADISLSELKIIKETLIQYLAQMNHERIVYPKNKNIKKQYESSTKQN